LICDNDNVAEYGKNLGIAGKCRYMAPEIVLEKAQPGIHTDKFSLAVVLFMLLMNNHPLEGKRSYPPCMTEKLERKIYGEQPLFIFDKDDDSNAPVPGINNNAIQRWSLYPSYVQDKFMEAFSQDALKDPSKRIIEKDWLKLFLRLRSEIFKCRNCGEIFFADPLTSTPCPSCGTEQRFEHHIKLSKINIAIHERTKLYDCYINTENDDFNTLCADMLLNETTASWELKNRSKKTWLVIDKNGKQLSKSAGKTFAPEEGMKIVFGNTIGEVV